MENEKYKYNEDVKKAIAFIFLLSLIIVVIINITFFNLTDYKFNTEMFLSILPFNLIGLSLTLYVVLAIFYNIGKSLIDSQ